jgi:hypothetical protein
MSGTLVTITLSLVGALALCNAERAARAMADTRTPVTIGARSGRGPLCDSKATTARAAGYSRLPLHFEINRGQSAPGVKFVSRGRGYNLALTATDAVLMLSSPVSGDRRRRDAEHMATSSAVALAPASVPKSTIVRMTFIGANAAAAVSGLEKLPGTANYFRGRDPKAWHTSIPTYARVAYTDLYPGVDLVYYGNQQQLEYDFIVAPAADPSRIALHFDGVDSLNLATGGDLLLRSAGGEIRQRKPSIYQLVGSSRQVIDGHYVLRGEHQVGFALGPYDKTKALVIDPVLAYSSYLGGQGTDRGEDIAVDAAGSAYIVGETIDSPDFPITNAFQPSSAGNRDIFVVKVSPDGGALVYSTYLGGAGQDFGFSVAIDGAGHAFLTGLTESTNFPVLNAVQHTHGGLIDAFVTKLSVGGDALIYSTYLGGSDIEIGRGVTVDQTGQAYVTGQTRSIDFPTAHAFQSALIGPSDAFVTKLSPDGSALAYSTYLGGHDNSPVDEGMAIAVNTEGNAYVTGVTVAPDFPTVNAFQPSLDVIDAFVAKFSTDGSSLLYSTYLGGNGVESGNDIAVDAAGRAVVVGNTTSSTFPTVRPVQPSLGGNFDGFVTKFSADGTTLLFSTYLGGSDPDEGHGVALDAAANVYVTGRASSTNFPIVNAIQATPGGSTDVFVTKMTPTGARLLYSTYLGGSGFDERGKIAVDPAGSAYVVGSTFSPDFPVVNAVQPVRPGDVDAFFAKITDFDVCLQDDQSGHSLQFSTSSGGYQFSACGAGGAMRLGIGSITQADNVVLLQDAGLFARYNTRLNVGIARISLPDGSFFAINDRNTTDNTCTCD